MGNLIEPEIAHRVDRHHMTQINVENFKIFFSETTEPLKRETGCAGMDL